MKILCLCDQGNNRSVMFAHLLKYWGHDTIPAGIKTNTLGTLQMLYNWADVIILTEESQREHISLHTENGKRVELFDVGPDTYPRPFNKELHELVKKFLEDNKSWLKLR